MAEEYPETATAPSIQAPCLGFGGEAVKLLQSNLLGDLEVLREGRRVELPASRRTRALLAYLVTLLRALEEVATARRERVVLLRGEPGIGKRRSTTANARRSAPNPC